MNEEMVNVPDANNNGIVDAKGLLEMLKAQGLDDESIEVLLSKAIQELHGEPAVHEEEIAGKLLGVEL